MADKPNKPPTNAVKTAQASLAQARRDAVTQELLYEGNPKHREPWQPGRRGSLCPAEVSLETAQIMLLKSHLHGKQRYAVHGGRLYAAKEHIEGRWHGHPLAWVEAPPQVRAHFKKYGNVQNSDIRRFWQI